MTTETQATTTVERYHRSTRWLHAVVYLSVLTLLATGTWLLIGREGDPSPLSELTGVSDARLHVWVGWALIGVLALGLVAKGRSLALFALESVRFRKTDLLWFRRWPLALFTGRFTRHEGQLDPGQRVANVVLAVALVAVLASGVGMALLHGGPAFVWLVRIHKWSTYILIPLLLGHIVIAAGVPPGYRGVWRSMHLGGRLDRNVAQRLWPAWTERHEDRRPPRGRSR
ncbi:MAG TPA: cytochrome b/b6 domain-containing protein [Actinomycetes bacterium]|nr:cytochrome b/b6 domain-containing protein [Actinomycetes bacterium]